MKKLIVDLHCDLLLYLIGDKSRTPCDPAARCSLPQLKAGGVGLQVLAIFTETGPDSILSASKQVAWFQKLPSLYPECKHAYSSSVSKGIGIMSAIENASGFFDEKEPLAKGFERLSHFINTIAKPLYISLTWNFENRFGGGNLSKVGLKSDGKELLSFLSGRKIAIDLSHTSDALAEGILNHIDSQGLDLPVIASHSNYRAVTDQPRNLPDLFASEIIRREGLIGLNFVRPFISNHHTPDFHRHLEHALQLGGQDSVCFGADFFYNDDVELKYGVPLFFEDFGNADCYPMVLESWRHDLGINEAMLLKICSQNFHRFFSKLRG